MFFVAVTIYNTTCYVEFYFYYFLIFSFFRFWEIFLLKMKQSCSLLRSVFSPFFQYLFKSIR